MKRFGYSLLFCLAIVACSRASSRPAPAPTSTQVLPDQTASPSEARPILRSPLGPVPTLDPASPFAEDISKAIGKWESLDINDYHIERVFYEAFVAGLTTRREVTVSSGQVVESSCQLNECPAFVLANVETVDDLFWVAKGGSILDGTLSECLQGIIFDSRYGFPNFVSIDCPLVYDDDNTVTVVKFEVIK